jgi:hypothetical protein
MNWDDAADISDAAVNVAVIKFLDPFAKVLPFLSG